MMPQTGSWHCFSFLFLLSTIHLSPILAYFLKDCTILYSDNVTAGVSVDCEHCHLVNIPDDFPRDVTSLTLSSNSITHVDDRVFVNLVELKDLHMNNNKLTTLTDNMFQGLSKLLLLRLDRNLIKFINPAAFQSLTNLKALNLEYNLFHQMTDIITILQLPRLEVLNISIHELVSFQSKDLPLNMLRELRVMSQSIKKFSITTAVFPHLKTIDLTNCCNKGWEWDIPDTYFVRNITKVYLSNSTCFDTLRKSLQSLDSLEYLQLVFMEQWIDRGILTTVCKIPTLRTLDLHFITNANLSEKVSPCTQLTNLDLSSNSLTDLLKDSIKQMKQLSHLNLRHNKLSKVPDDVKHLSMLQILNLESNSIDDLGCLDFLNLTRLTHLHLDNNRIGTLKQCVFQHLSALKVLTMNANFIQMFGDAFNEGLRKLEFLDLKRNSFVLLERGHLESLKSLKHLGVESDRLTQWEGTTFVGLDELETLSLNSRCLINPIQNHINERIDHDLPSLKSLKSFTIQFNFRSEYPTFTTFKNTPQLKALTFSGNNWQYMKPAVFDPIPNLEALDLSINNLMSLNFLAQANLTRLSWLDLSQNELTVINVSVFTSLPALRYVNMSDNPFACDCSNVDFQLWVLNNNQTQVVGARHYTCGYPLALKGTRFLDFDIHSCWIEPTSFNCYIYSTCAIVLTLLTSFTYLYLRRQQLYADYLSLAFLYDAKERKRGSPQQYDAFISYNVHDELWVYREMLPVLEGEQGWRLCLHHRDFQLGKTIIENITNAIYGSRKTICVISHHFLESEWCSREIQMARMRSGNTLILVFLEDIPAQHLSSYDHMRGLVKRRTYLSWPQSAQHTGRFWQNLRRVLETGDTHLSRDRSTHLAVSVFA